MKRPPWQEPGWQARTVDSIASPLVGRGSAEEFRLSPSGTEASSHQGSRPPGPARAMPSYSRAIDEPGLCADGQHEVGDHGAEIEHGEAVDEDGGADEREAAAEDDGDALVVAGDGVALAGEEQAFPMTPFDARLSVLRGGPKARGLYQVQKATSGSPRATTRRSTRGSSRPARAAGGWQSACRRAKGWRGAARPFRPWPSRVPAR